MKATATLSVVLCTYNGAAYLQQQLDSIAAQTSLPDELLISDDASTDDTVTIAAEFARKAPFEVRMDTNPINLGFIPNFEKVIELAKGDLIALCDQDDVWQADKIEKLRDAFARRPSLGLVFSDGEVVDHELAPLNSTLFEYAGFDERRQNQARSGNAFDVMLNGNVVTGATMAFRTKLRGLALPIPIGIGRYHDAWIALMASAVTEVDFINEPLIKYRQHENQVTGVRRQERPAVLGRGHYRDHVDFLELVDSRLVEGWKPTPKLDDSRSRLADRLAHVRTRAQMPESRLRRLSPLVRELISGRYGRYSSGLKSVVRDLVCG